MAFVCAICNTECVHKSSLLRHIKLKHQVKLEDGPCGFQFNCAHCKYGCNRKDTLQRHILACHFRNETYTCECCKRNFAKKISLVAHLRNKSKPKVPKKVKPNPEDDPNIKKSYICALCHMPFARKKSIWAHLSSQHNIQLETVNLKFHSFEEFLLWKEDQEKTTRCNYPRMHTDKGKRFTSQEYRCARSGRWNSRETDRKRRLKLQGSKKINGYCPSQMEVKIFDDRCTVEYVTTHVAHGLGEKELTHFRLCESDRKMIACKLAAGVPIDGILENISLSIDSSADKLSLIGKRDIRNIARKYNLCPIKISQQDLDLNTFLDEHKDWILHCKKQDEKDDVFAILNIKDFFLVLMAPLQKQLLMDFGRDMIAFDSTQNVNLGGISLHTILVIDEYKEIVPTSFLITNRNDKLAIDLYLRMIKEEIGNFNVHIFYSNLQDVYHDSWCEAISTPMHRFYFTSQVHETWKNKLYLIADKEKRKVLYEELIELSNEPDCLEFQQKLGELLETDDEDYVKYLDYFEKSFARCSERWAQCYRTISDINVNMDIEPFRKSVPYWYSKKHKTKNLTAGLNVLKNYWSRQIRTRNSKNINGELSFDIKTIRSRHDIMTRLTAKPEIVVEKDCWQISTFKKPEDHCLEYYTVKKTSSGCTYENCQRICQECQICIHQYECTCLDGSVRGNMCKHIHYLAFNMYFNSIEEEIAEIDEYVVEDEVSFEKELPPVDTIHPIVDEDMDNENIDIEKEKNKLQEEFKDIVDIADNPDELEEIKKIISMMRRSIDRKSSIPNIEIKTDENFVEVPSE